jgi:hypothetical protein
MYISDFNCDGRSSFSANFCECSMPERLTSLFSLILIGLTSRDSGFHAQSRPPRWLPRA